MELDSRCLRGVGKTALPWARDDGLVCGPRGQVAFTVPGFADFTRRTQTAQTSTA